MTAVTEVLARVTSERRRNDLSGVWEADLDRCAVEVRLRDRPSIWRARLRTISLRVTLPENYLRDGLVSMAAVLAVDPIVASVPATRGAFLPATPRTDHLSVSGSGPVLSAVGAITMRAHAHISTGNREWVAPLSIRMQRFDDQRLGLSVTGSVPRSVPGPFPRTRLHIDVATDLVRCG